MGQHNKIGGITFGAALVLVYSEKRNSRQKDCAGVMGCAVERNYTYHY